MALFYNKATLSYGGNIVNSNTTEAELLSGLELVKTPITSTYTSGSGVVYTVSLNNMGSVAYNALNLTDNLGAYTLPSGTTVVPLTYVDGSILYYLNGVLQPAPTVSGTDRLVIEGINLPSNSTATFIYEARANEFAPMAMDAQIINRITTNGGAGIGEISDTATVSVEETAKLTIAKAICPTILNDNEPLTYTIVVQNLGNKPIVATDGVVISDVFDPVLSELTVMLNGTELVEGTGYTYNATTGEFAIVNGVITVPAATYIQDPISGTITTTPGVTTVTVVGTV